MGVLEDWRSSKFLRNAWDTSAPRKNGRGVFLATFPSSQRSNRTMPPGVSVRKSVPGSLMMSLIHSFVHSFTHSTPITY